MMTKTLPWVATFFIGIFILTSFLTKVNLDKEEYKFEGIEYPIDSVLVDLQGDGQIKPIWGNFYLNIFVKPAVSDLNDDIVVQIFPRAGENLKIANPKVTIDLSVSSGSFEVEPKSQVLILDESWPYDIDNLPFEGNYKKIEFILTPKSEGKKKIRVTSKIDFNKHSDVIMDFKGDEIWKEQSKIIDVEIIKERNFLGITKQVLEIIKLVSGLLGFPALIVYIIEKRKKKKSTES